MTITTAMAAQVIQRFASIRWDARRRPHICMSARLNLPLGDPWKAGTSVPDTERAPVRVPAIPPELNSGLTRAGWTTLEDRGS
jgi:hypothetical protein